MWFQSYGNSGKQGITLDIRKSKKARPDSDQYVESQLNNFTLSVLMPNKYIVKFNGFSRTVCYF